ncbi:hypothetical protein [Singulisphaera sp. PoT]|uniref:hypothetical protein n=1 Tax=Singulisphaera sp. PoT TaxID=3411797 RepID=UPI003BF59D35
MGLEIFVMPLWKFKAGDFSRPVEQALGVRSKIVSGDGISEMPESVGWFARRRARRQVDSLRKAVASANGVSPGWVDEGSVVYSSQSRGFEPLRAYARWLDCRDQFPDFAQPPEGDYYKHPVMAADIDVTTCPHLVKHNCYSGYFLPCEFERLAQVEPYKMFGHWPATRAVGSTPRLLRELERVQEVLQAPYPYDYSNDDPLVDVKAAYLHMKKTADISLQHGLPIIFWG